MKKITEKKPERESGIELLRILTMFGVVILHYNNKDIGGAFSYVGNGSVNEAILYFLEGVFICAVDLFVLISGFFLVNTQKRKAVRTIELIVQVIAFRLLIYLAGVVLQSEPFSAESLVECLIPNNYFVTLYIVVYILSPYINIILHKADLKQFVLLIFIVFSVLPSFVDLVQELLGHRWSGICTIGSGGTQSGYTIVNFLMMYCIGGAIRLTKIYERFNNRKIIPACFSLLIAVILAEFGKETPGFAWEYCNPLVILEAVCVFLLFKNIHFSSRIVNNLAKASFTCYLIHQVFFNVINIEYYVQRPFYIMLLHIIVSVAAIYLISFGVYWIYNAVTVPLFRKLDQYLTKKKIDFSI